MRPIPQKHKDIISSDLYYSKCARDDEGTCQGRITIEHAIIYAGRQLNELWAYVPLCAYHHAVDEFQDSGDLNKEKNVWLALKRATDEELDKVSKSTDYKRLRDLLDEIYNPRKNTK